MPIRWILLGLGLAFVALGWWRVLQRRGRATGTVTIAPQHRSRGRASRTEIAFTVAGRSSTFHPSVVTSFDVGRLDVGVEVPVAYDESDPSSADIAAPWRMYWRQVMKTLVYAVCAYDLFPG